MALRQLTPAQHRVLVLMARGLTGPEIAVLLSNSLHTIIRHKRHIRDRLEARTGAHAVAIAFCAGALRPEDIVRE